MKWKTLRDAFNCKIAGYTGEYFLESPRGISMTIIIPKDIDLKEEMLKTLARSLGHHKLFNVFLEALNEWQKRKIDRQIEAILNALIEANIEYQFDDTLKLSPGGYLIDETPVDWYDITCTGKLRTIYICRGWIRLQPPYSLRITLRQKETIKSSIAKVRTLILKNG